MALRRSPTTIDRHHLIFPRQEWSLRPEGARIRETGSLMPVMFRQDHDQLHREIPMIPVLGHTTLMAVGRRFHPRGQTLGDIDLLCSTIDRVSLPQHQLERGMAELAISALEIEKQFLKENGYGRTLER